MNQDNKQAIRVALVTGAARRIGAAIVQLLHSEGFNTVIHCHRSTDEAQQLATILNHMRPDSALVLPFDLAKPNAGEYLIEETLKWGGQLDVLVNNASQFTRSDLNNGAYDTQERLFAINVFAPFALSTAAYPALSQRHGNIINITDIHADRPLKNYAVYCQTKAALVMQTKALAREFAPHVRVNAVAPGAIAWPEQDNELSKEAQAEIIAKTPLKCHGQPAYIAQAVMAMLENPFINGQVVNVDGGRSIVE